MSCASGWLYFCAVDGKSVVDQEPYRIALPSLDRDWADLQGFMNSVRSALGDLGAARIGFLLPEMVYKANYSQLGDRAACEVLVRAIAADMHIPFERLKRPTFRSKLKKIGISPLPGGDILPKSGLYWREGRELAALAARAVTGI